MYVSRESPAFFYNPFCLYSVPRCQQRTRTIFNVNTYLLEVQYLSNEHGPDVSLIPMIILLVVVLSATTQAS